MFEIQCFFKNLAKIHFFSRKRHNTLFYNMVQSISLARWMFSISILAFSFLSCKKDNDSNVPDVNVDVYLYLSQPSNVPLNAVGGWIYHDGGNRGLLIYRRGLDDFAAYDRNCPYDPAQACATVFVQSDNFTVRDSCCNSNYSIFDGSVLSGPSSQGLRAYNTYFDGGNVLRVYN